jgi:hypothetical protein
MDNSTEDKKQEMVIEKKPRKASAYNIFVKQNYKKCEHLPVKERFSYLGQLWKSEQEKKPEKKTEKKSKK